MCWWPHVYVVVILLILTCVVVHFQWAVVWPMAMVEVSLSNFLCVISIILFCILVSVFFVVFLGNVEFCYCSWIRFVLRLRALRDAHWQFFAGLEVNFNVVSVGCIPAVFDSHCVLLGFQGSGSSWLAGDLGWPLCPALCEVWRPMSPGASPMSTPACHMAIPWDSVCWGCGRLRAVCRAVCSGWWGLQAWVVTKWSNGLLHVTCSAHPRKKV